MRSCVARAASPPDTRQLPKPLNMKATDKITCSNNQKQTNMSEVSTFSTIQVTYRDQDVSHAHLCRRLVRQDPRRPPIRRQLAKPHKVRLQLHLRRHRKLLREPHEERQGLERLSRRLGRLFGRPFGRLFERLFGRFGRPFGRLCSCPRPFGRLADAEHAAPVLCDAVGGRGCADLLPRGEGCV
jgi:hypothetical protein